MATGKSHPIHNLGQITFDTYAPLTAQVYGSITGVVPVTIVNPAATEKWRLYGGEITAVVTTVLNGGVAGNMLALYEETAGRIFEILGVITEANLVAGSIFPGTTTDATITSSAAVWYPQPTQPYRFGLVPNQGRQATTANKDLLLAVVDAAGAVKTVDTGVIAVAGYVTYELV